MSVTIKDAVAAQRSGGQEVIARGGKQENGKNYKGFVAGVFSGIAKLSGKYPIRTRRRLDADEDFNTSSIPLYSLAWSIFCNNSYNIWLTSSFISGASIRYYKSTSSNLRSRQVFWPSAMPRPDGTQGRARRPV